ncbi:conserved hypothetical protein [Ruegeria sp. TrichCH4B]|nr:conserved hypothetical protein [Ruegeria sp. TrichCH4B]
MIVPMTLLRRYTALLLAAALLLTGHSAAASRFARDATGQVILCTGTGPVTVYVDENGEPTGAPHICPDCITHILDLAQSPMVFLAPAAVTRQAHRLPSRAQSDVATERTARARAPPLV